MSIIDDERGAVDRRRNEAEIPNSVRQERNLSGKFGGSLANAIDLDDEFDDDLMLDDEAEKSILRIEESFQQTQRKRARSPSDDGDVKRKLASKDEEIRKLRASLQTKEGEVFILRQRYNSDISDYGIMLREQEAVSAEHRGKANLFKEANERLIAENKTLQSFRSMEANTNLSSHVWNNVSASVARRRAMATTHATGRAAGTSSASRDLSQSHSQNVAASVGLITPTRRNRHERNRNLGSPSNNDSNSSPSARHDASDRRSAARNGAVTGETSAKATAKKSGFPSFVNAFAKPLLVKETQVDGAGGRTSLNFANVPDEEVFLDRNNDVSSPAIQEIADAFSPPTSHILNPSQNIASVVRSEVNNEEGGASTVAASSQISRWSDPRLRYLWAVKMYTQRQSLLASIVLSYSSKSVPAEQNEGAVRPPITTLQQLLQSPLSDDCSPRSRNDYDAAASVLLNALSMGTALDAEYRFAYLLEPLHYEKEAKENDLNAQQMGALDEEALWECIALIEEGVDEVLDTIISALKIMLAMAYKVGAYERVCDVLTLFRSMAVHFGSVAKFVVSIDDVHDKPQEHAQEEDGDDMAMNLETQQHDVEASLQRRQKRTLTEDVGAVVTGCVRFACSAGSEKERASRQRQANASLLDSVVGILELLVLETFHNDAASLQCTHKLKGILDHPGTLTAMLDARKVEAQTIQRLLNVLTITCQHDSLWRIALACRPDKSIDSKHLQQRKSSDLTRTKHQQTPLIDLLAKLLVDGRLDMNCKSMHATHMSAITLVSQLVVCRPDDSLSMVASSTVLAMLVKCLQLDTDLAWNYGAADVAEASNERWTLRSMVDCVERIRADVRLMAFIFCSSTANEQMLARKLMSSETHHLLNGIRQYFVVSLSRVAFASEPAWTVGEMHKIADEGSVPSPTDATKKEEQNAMCVQARVALNDVNDLATELLELILSPEELESCWEALVDEDDDEEMQQEDAA